MSSVALPTTHLDLAAARFAVTWLATGTHQVLALVDDDVWFWTLASPEPAWASLAGTFRCDASDGERNTLLAAAAPVADGTLADSAAPGGLAVAVTAAGRTVRVDAGSDAAARVGAAVAPLLAEARPSPVRAVRLRAARMAAPGSTEMLGLAVTSVGTEPALLGLDGAGVRVVAPDGAWESVPPPRMGLVAEAGTLLDGLYAPATIPAGGTGAWVLAGATATPGHRVLAGGSIALAGPWPVEDSPVLAFDFSATVE